MAPLLVYFLWQIPRRFFKRERDRETERETEKGGGGGAQEVKGVSAVCGSMEMKLDN